MKAKNSPRDIELLSAYLDQQLDSGKRARLEARMRAEPELRSAIDDLRRTRALLRSLPRLKAPRNFMLTPQMVGRVQARESSARRIYPVFQFASALASLLLVVVLLGDFLGLRVPLAAAPLAGDSTQPEFAVREAPSAAGIESSTAATATTAQPTGGAITLEDSGATPGVPQGQLKSLAVPAPGVTPTITTTTPLTLTVPMTQAIALAPTAEASLPSNRVVAGQPESSPPDRSLWRAAEICLALLALASGMAAIYLRKH